MASQVGRCRVKTAWEGELIMARFKVKICITRSIECYGSDEDEAMEKACEIVSGWKDVEDVEAIDAEEI